MRKWRLYIETSVWSHLDADDAPDRRAETERFFARCEASGGRAELLGSVTVLNEIAGSKAGKRAKLESFVRRYRPRILPVSDEVTELAGAYVLHGAIPPSKMFDAVHAAVATVEGADALVSWNYRHLVGIERENRINGVNLLMGYRGTLRIVTPSEVLSDGIQ